MIDTDKYEPIYEWVWYDDIGRDFTARETFDWYVEMRKKGYKVFLEHKVHPPAHYLLAEVKRLRERLATIKGDIDGYVSGKGWDGNIEGWQCISDSIAALGIESESEEE